MVSLFLSYRAGDEEYTARLIDDALTDRFGGDSCGAAPEPGACPG